MKDCKRLVGTIFGLLGLLVSIASVHAQSIKQSEPSPLPTSINTPPGWAIAASAKSTAIASNTATTARWFLISRGIGSPTISVTLRVDGKESPFSIHPGGSVLVYGTNVSAEHVSGSDPSSGVWNIVPMEKLLNQASYWFVNPEGSPQALVAMLDKKHEFVLDFATPDIDPPNKTCKNGKMIVNVDGTPLEDGKMFEQGSTVIASGKEIGVSVSGVCDPHAVFYGRIILLN